MNVPKAIDYLQLSQQEKNKVALKIMENPSLSDGEKHDLINALITGYNWAVLALRELRQENQ